MRKLSKNYHDYLKGKAKLQHAVHIDPEDKAFNMIQASTNHRFWASDYNAFKKRLSENEAPLSTGMGNPVAPTETTEGSGDKFEPETPKRKKKV
jgi:hypothetical protein